MFDLQPGDVRPAEALEATRLVGTGQGTVPDLRPTPSELRQVAFAVPRKVGTAVERNRVRRRLRAVVTEVAGAVPAGSYLVGIDQGVRGLPFQELRTKVIEAMQRASQVAPR